MAIIFSPGEQLLVNFREEMKTAPQSASVANVLWTDFSNKWFTMMPSTVPFAIRSYKEFADFVWIRSPYTSSNNRNYFLSILV